MELPPKSQFLGKVQNFLMHQKVTSFSQIKMPRRPGVQYLFLFLQHLRGRGDFWDTRYSAQVVSMIVFIFGLSCYLCVEHGSTYYNSFQRGWRIVSHISEKGLLSSDRLGGHCFYRVKRETVVDSKQLG